jgi:hypothetical protein
MTAILQPLDKNPALDLSQDFYELRRRGIGFVQKAGSDQWTDYNVHDPGITILEALSYAITDLGYRLAPPTPLGLPTASRSTIPVSSALHGSSQSAPDISRARPAFSTRPGRRSAAPLSLSITASWTPRGRGIYHEPRPHASGSSSAGRAHRR